jgi:hypothetical protein
MSECISMGYGNPAFAQRPSLICCACINIYSNFHINLTMALCGRNISVNLHKSID